MEKYISYYHVVILQCCTVSVLRYYSRLHVSAENFVTIKLFFFICLFFTQFFTAASMKQFHISCLHLRFSLKLYILNLYKILFYLSLILPAISNHFLTNLIYIYILLYIYIYLFLYLYNN